METGGIELTKNEAGVGLPGVGQPSVPTRHTVVIIDDEPTNIELLKAILAREPSIRIESTTDSTAALDLIRATNPDLLLLDLMMPNINGFQIMEQLRSEQIESEYHPILVLTADASQKTIHRALEVGATDFLTKPVDPTEVFLRIGNLLHTRDLYLQVANHNAQLESRVAARTAQLARAKLELLERLARATEYRDDDTGEHAKRVGVNAALVWSALGLSAEGEGVIQQAAPLHDIGKIGVPDNILLKPGRLTADEFEVVKTHTTIGAHILRGSDFPVLQMSERIARWHHENWDGSGYPDRLSMLDIPIEARIVKVCDVFDALVSERPYKQAWSVSDALEELERSRGVSADADVVDAFCQLVEQGLIRHVPKAAGQTD